MKNADVLSLAGAFPTADHRPGEIIIEQDGDSPELLILVEGTVEVKRDAQLVAVVDEPGAILGEVSMLLGSASTADVVARDAVKLAVVADPDALFTEHPTLALFVARQLAERLARVTDYLADLKDEFGDSDGRLGLVPEIVTELVTWRRVTAEAADLTERSA